MGLLTAFVRGAARDAPDLCLRCQYAERNLALDRPLCFEASGSTLGAEQAGVGSLAHLGQFLVQHRIPFPSTLAFLTMRVRCDQFRNGPVGPSR